jgi:DNA-directed RNA polymerase beta subunit
MMERADNFSILVDDKNGEKINSADFDILTQTPKKIEIPYSMNLLTNEVNALGIKMNYITQKNIV